MMTMFYNNNHITNYARDWMIWANKEIVIQEICINKNEKKITLHLVTNWGATAASVARTFQKQLYTQTLFVHKYNK